MSTQLPRLANLIALRSPDAGRRRLLTERLHQAGWQLHQPAPLWLVATQALPGSSPADARDEAAGLFCCADQASLPQKTEARARHRAWIHHGEQAARGEAADDLHCLSILPDNSARFRRSLGGNIPAYWWRDGQDDLWLSTTSGDLIANAGHDGTPDRLMTVLCLQGQYSQQIGHRSHLAGVSKLGFAESLAITPEGRVSCQANWLPPSRDDIRWPSRTDRQARAARFRELLDGQLARELSRDGMNLLTLSGGVDSSLLLALCSELGRPLATYSQIPPAHDGHHAREVARLDWLLQRYPCPLGERRPLDQVNSPAAMQALQPAAMPMFNPTQAGLRLLQDRAGTHVSLGGEHADIVCGSYHFTPLDWLLHAPRRAILLPPQSFPRGVKRLDLLHGKRHFIDFSLRWNAPLTRSLEPWLHRDIHEEWREARGELVAALRADLDNLGNPMLWNFHVQSEWQAMQWEWCSAQRVRRINPFSSSAMMALALHSHPGERLAFRDKQLSRRAYAGRFPSELLGRHDKGGVAIPTPPRETSTQALRELLQDLHPSWQGLVDAGILAAQGRQAETMLPVQAGLVRRMVSFSRQGERLVRRD